MENLAAPELPEPEPKACQDANCVAVFLQFVQMAVSKVFIYIYKFSVVGADAYAMPLLFLKFSVCAYPCPICESKMLENTIVSLFDFRLETVRMPQ